MKNVEISTTGTILTIEVDLSKTYGHSRSGKSTIIASTEGNTSLGDNIYMGLNIYKK